ncbi:HsdM family class I SAM-dependent methyltransferase [Pyrococcus kukulkanii]|uniref:HsdM family class I SAM-dependent methyltransferase n=1 Tax=Pyrococcus kukulkanii TaxID=1609559 RepID=UPI0035654EE3
MRRVERQLQGVLLQVFNDVIKKRNLEDKIQVVQEEDRADIILQTPSGKKIFFIELKDPIAQDGRSVYDYRTFNREFDRAMRNGFKYFGICNFIQAMLYDVREDSSLGYKEGFLTHREIDKYRESGRITASLKEGLREIAEWYLDLAVLILKGRAVAKPIDEHFIYKIRSLINSYSVALTDIVWERMNKDSEFKREVYNYFRSQLWTVPSEKESIEKLVHISLLTLASKLIFYKAVSESRVYRKKLPKLVVEDTTTAEKLYEDLWDEYFDVLVEVTNDYELLIGKRDDFINRLPFLTDEIVEFVKDIVEAWEHYDFSKLDYDIIGKIFEGLIKEEERHALGQYFTPSQVVDLILSFCIRDGNEKVLDPSCGSGTFLVRAYERKKKLKKKRHPDLLKEIYGVDISSYAVYLSMFNLAIRDLRYPSYPRIIHKDFFDLQPDSPVKVIDLGGEEKTAKLPLFDAIVGNPPYTRQEEIDEIIPGEKEKIVRVIERELGMTPPKRSSIYTYFFYHSLGFLKEGGYLGFITSNSWLDTDYGKTLQRFFLENFKIIAIIDSKVERFFISADVNTAITILQKTSDDESRKKNLVKFVYLKKPLAEVIRKFGDVDKLRYFIETTNKLYDDEYLFINPIPQEELGPGKWGRYLRAPAVYWKILSRGKWVKLKDVAKVRRGFTTGANWFFYVEDVTDEIDDKKFATTVKNKLTIRDIEEAKAEGLRVVRNGKNELWLIEEELLKPVIKSPREIRKYYVDETEVKYKVFLVPKKKDKKDEKDKKDKTPEQEQVIEEVRTNYPHAWRYIEHGEKEGVHENPTCKTRKPWFCLGGEIIGDIVMNERVGERCAFYWNQKVNINKNLYAIYIKQDDHKKTIWGLLNSTITRLFIETEVRSLTGAVTAVDIDVNVAESIRIPDPKSIGNPEEIVGAMEKLKDTEVLSIFDELGATTPEEVSLDKVKPERLALDRAVLKAVGFGDDEIDDVLLELYRAVVDTVKSRLEKAESVQNEKSKRNSVKVEVLLEEVEAELARRGITPRKSLKFAEKLKEVVSEITPLRKMQRKIINAYWRKTFGEAFSEKKLREESQKRLTEFIDKQ